MTEKETKISDGDGSKDGNVQIPSTPLEWADELQELCNRPGDEESCKRWNRIFLPGLAMFGDDDECRTSEGVPASMLFAFARMHWRAFKLPPRDFYSRKFVNAEHCGMTALDFFAAPRNWRYKIHFAGIDDARLAAQIPGISEKMLTVVFYCPLIIDLLSMGADASDVDVLPYAEAACLVASHKKEMLPDVEWLPYLLILAGADHSFLGDPKWNDMPYREETQSFIDEKALEKVI